MDDSDSLEAKLDRHDHILSTKKSLPIIMSLALCCFLNMSDSTSVTIASPYIAKDLNAERTIQWAGTALLISNAIFTVCTGRLSDIFGRKVVLLGSGMILALSDLAIGFVKTDYQFFILRGVAGIGNGALNSIPIIVVSDVVSLHRRGLFQGILGSSISLGLAIGPFIMSAFVEHTAKSWRGFYFFMCPSILLTCALNYYILPSSTSSLSNKEILKNFDYLGSFLSAASCILLLIPINGGGNMYPWNSALVISMFSVGGFLFILFLFVEWKVAKLPMIPLRLFKSLSLSNLLLQAFLYGIVWASVLYYMPFYVELVRGISIIKSCAYLAIIQLSTTAFSVVSGWMLHYFDGYNYVIWFGFALWTLVNGLMLTLSTDSSMVSFSIYMMLLGIAIGCTFQPTILAIQANAPRRDRSLALGVRNVLRALGNSVGVAISSLIYTNTLVKNTNMEKSLPQYLKTIIIDNAYAKPDLALFNSQQKIVLRKLLMKSMRNIFIMWIPLIGVCLLFSFFIKDHRLKLDEVSGEQSDINIEERSSSKKEPVT